MLKEQIYQAMRPGNVSYVELSRIPGFKGNWEILHGEFDNIILWQGVSEEAVTAMRELKQEDRAHWLPAPSGILPYMIDGGILRLPLAKRARHYKSPHWLPVLWHQGPPPAWVR